MANQFTAQGSIDTSSHVALLDKMIDTLFMRTNEFQGMLAELFDVEKKTEGLYHTITSMGEALPLPVRSTDTDALAYFMPAPGFKKQIILYGYRSGIRVTDTIMRATRFSVIGQMVSGQVKSGFVKDEYMRAAILNGCFTGTSGADSLSLCHDSHPHENPEAGTWDNKGTGALTGPNLHALRLLARQMKNEQGDPQPVSPKTLWVPPALEYKALELTRLGRGKPETNFNEENVLLPELAVKVSPYFSSAVQYWITGDRQGYLRGLHEVVLLDWNVKDNTPANADIVIDKRVKAIKAFAFTTSKNVFGSTGS